MALFGENKEPVIGRPAGTSAPNQINMVGAGTTFEGTFRTEGDVSVSGRLVGELHVGGRAVVTQEGLVEGRLVAAHADLSGTVQGEVEVAEKLVLRGTARLEGNVQTGRLIVEEGAVFDGECRMGEAGKLLAKTDGPHQAVLPPRPEPPAAAKPNDRRRPSEPAKPPAEGGKEAAGA